MKLAYIDPHPVPDTTPSTLQMLQNVDAFGALGARVFLITPRSALAAESLLGRPLSQNVVVCHQTDHRRRWYFPTSSHKLFFWQARRWLEQHPVDAVLVRNLKLAEYLLRQGLSVPVFFETHELFAQTFLEEHPTLAGSAKRKHAALQARESLVYNSAAGVFALTALLRDDLKKAYGMRAPCWVAPDGVDLQLAERACAPAGPPHIPARLLYLGSLHPWKGVPVLIEAMRQVTGAQLWIAGGTDERIAELRAQAAAAGLTDDAIRFLGRVAPAARFELIAQCDVCLLPLKQTSIGSRYTSPLKLFEYMAMGKPVIVSDLPSIHEVIDPAAFSALYSRPDDPVDVARKIMHLLTHTDELLTLGLRMHELARHYTWETRCTRMLQHMTGDRSPGST